MNERKVVYGMMVSVDGFIEGPGHDISWHVIDEELHRFVNQRESNRSGFLYGRGMYETMSAFWPTADADPSNPDFVIEFARIWKRTPKIVFSTTLKDVGENTRLVTTDIAGEVHRLKEKPGQNLSLGGAGIASSFAKLGLIDEYEIYVHPVIIGNGTRMFAEGDQTIPLELVETHTFSSGVVFLHYRSLLK